LFASPHFFLTGDQGQFYLKTICQQNASSLANASIFLDGAKHFGLMPHPLFAMEVLLISTLEKL